MLPLGHAGASARTDRGGREGVADLVVAQRDGGHRGELRGAAMVEALASMKSGGQIQSNGPIDTGPATTAAA